MRALVMVVLGASVGLLIALAYRLPGFFTPL